MRLRFRERALAISPGRLRLHEFRMPLGESLAASNGLSVFHTGSARGTSPHVFYISVGHHHVGAAPSPVAVTAPTPAAIMRLGVIGIEHHQHRRRRSDHLLDLFQRGGVRRNSLRPVKSARSADAFRFFRARRRESAGRCRSPGPAPSPPAATRKTAWTAALINARFDDHLRLQAVDHLVPDQILGQLQNRQAEPGEGVIVRQAVADADPLQRNCLKRLFRKQADAGFERPVRAGQCAPGGYRSQASFFQV